jgi:putative MATE family efflux protein
MMIVLRTVGVVKLPLVTGIITLLNNILLNWLFVFGNLGMPQMGIAGSALATTISRVLEFVVITVFIFVIDKKIALKPKMLLVTDRAIMNDYLKHGLPVLCSDFALALGMNAVAAIVGHISTDFVTANAIASMIWQFTTVFLMGTSGASSVIIGNTVGAKRYEDAQKYGVTFLAIGVIVGVFSGLVLFLLRNIAVQIPIFQVKDQVRIIAADLMGAIAVLSIFASAQMMLTKGVLRAGGDTRFLMIADMLFLWVISIPLGLLVGLVFHAPPFVVLLCIRIDEVIKAFWCIWRLMGKRWIKNVTILPGQKELISS